MKIIIFTERMFVTKKNLWKQINIGICIIAYLHRFQKYFDVCYVCAIEQVNDPQDGRKREDYSF